MTRHHGSPQRLTQRLAQRLARRFAAVLVAVLAALVATAPTANAGLLGGLLGVVGSVVGVLTPGWDDGATTQPVSMATVAQAVGADQLWARGVDGTGVGVALIDSGVVPVDGLTGPGKVVNGPDISFESQGDGYRYLDTYGHGTHMAGIIAGRDSGSFRGIAPGARLVSLKLGSRDGATDVSQIIAAIDWVVQHRNDPGLNIRVLNLSYGTDGRQDYRLDPLTHAVEVAARHGIVVVVSGGNSGTDLPSLTNPARDPYVIAVGAADLKGTASISDDAIAPFSSRGNRSRAVDVVAPGVSITSLRDPGSSIDVDHPSAVVNERFFRGSGTSQAAAVTSGAAALLLSARPDLRPDEVKALLRSTARPISGAGSRDQGAGRIDVARAAAAAVPFGATQSWSPSQGTGSLELARGSAHVASGGVDLVGERDIMGRAWSGLTWAPQAGAGAAWTGGTWNGSPWTGACLCQSSWAGPAWATATWPSTSWAAQAWSSDPTAGPTWSGGKWSGGKWSGGKWSGGKWSGSGWASQPPAN